MAGQETGIRSIVLGVIWLLGMTPVMAQELDMDFFPVDPVKPPAQAAPTVAPKPLTATVTKSLYLPPAMYGHWSVKTHLMETNYAEFFRPVITDTWVLSREGDQVVVTNPANGASASVQVDEVTGNRATFRRTSVAGRNKVLTEVPTITVNGDTMVGEVLNRFDYVKDGQVTKSYFARYALQATRIGESRTQFIPEGGLGDPELIIEDVRRAP